MARQWSARCYGVARQREGSRQNSIGAPACFLSGIFRAGSLDPLARGCRRIWPARCCSTGSGRLDLDLWFRPARCCSTGSGRLDLDLWFRPARCCSTGSGRLDLDLWFRPARCCSTGSGRLDLDLLISGPRVNLVYQPYARGGADGQAVVCPLLRGSSPTRGVAPNRKTRRLLTNRPCSSLVYEESDSKERLRVSNWIVQRLYNYAVKKTCLLYTSPSPRDRTRSRM